MSRGDSDAAQSLGLTVFIGQRKPADLPDYDGWSGFAIFSA